MSRLVGGWIAEAFEQRVVIAVDFLVEESEVGIDTKNTLMVVLRLNGHASPVDNAAIDIHDLLRFQIFRRKTLHKSEFVDVKIPAEKKNNHPCGTEPKCRQDQNRAGTLIPFIVDRTFRRNGIFGAHANLRVCCAS